MSVIRLAGVNIKSSDNPPIGAKNNENFIVYTPTNEAGEEVYLFVIANPDGEDIYINGEKYAPSNHTAADHDDTNLYVYLANGRHTVRLGHSGEKVWTIDKNGHELKWDCCGETEISKGDHSFYRDACTECGYVHPFRIVFCFCRIVWDIILAFDSLFEAIFG